MVFAAFPELLLVRYAFEERVEQLWSLLGEVLAKVEAAHGPGQNPRGPTPE